MNFANEAGEAARPGRDGQARLRLPGLKPVNWCFDCGSALAEAEVEYQDKQSPHRRRLPCRARKLAAAFGLAALAAGKPPSS
jgi:isoleucyl-tRNA synthetase